MPEALPLWCDPTHADSSLLMPLCVALCRLGCQDADCPGMLSAQWSTLLLQAQTRVTVLKVYGFKPMGWLIYTGDDQLPPPGRPGPHAAHCQHNSGTRGRQSPGPQAQDPPLRCLLHWHRSAPCGWIDVIHSLSLSPNYECPSTLAGQPATTVFAGTCKQDFASLLCENNAGISNPVNFMCYACACKDCHSAAV